MTINVRQRGVELDRLEQDLNTLRIDFERFFNGDLEVPPEPFRESIRGQFASLQQANKTPVDTFRLGGLDAPPTGDQAEVVVPAGGSRDLALVFAGAGDQVAAATVLVVAPGVELQAYAEWL